MKAYAIGMVLMLLGACEMSMMETDDVMGPSLDGIQVAIFDQACVEGCHSADVRAGDLDLSNADASYEALIGVMAENDVAYENRWMRVKPGEPDLSFLIRKIEQPGVGEGAAMPMGPSELTGYYVDMISEWIALGAPR